MSSALDRLADHASEHDLHLGIYYSPELQTRDLRWEVRVWEASGDPVVRARETGATAYEAAAKALVATAPQEPSA